MTTPKVSTISRGGSRFYVHPNTREKVPGVTSVLDMLPKPFLGPWQAKLVAETAFDDFGSLATFVAKGDRTAAVDWLKRAPRRSTDKAADIGTDVHAIFERMCRGEEIGRVHPDLEPSVEHLTRFMDLWQPEPLEIEATVWSDTYGYAGSFDLIAKIAGEVVILDLKTGKGVYPSVGLQMTAYSRADFILRPDGTQVPMPKIDGAAVLHVRPDFWNLSPVAITDELFEVFQALMVVFKFEKELSRDVIGQPLLAS